MSLIFVHLSDIHFGQERGGHLYINNDVKEQLLADAYEYVSQLNNRKADGVIISGDIAYGGKLREYDIAARWLDRLTAAVGCEITAVQVVPGNHDIDFDEITNITQIVIDDIIENGHSALEKYLESEVDRELIYKRFQGYRKFAEGYDCPLDADGRVAKDHIFEIAPGRKLNFLGMNTALICSKSKKEFGGLILGKRQHVIPVRPGMETVVIAHHPLSWLQDSEEAKLFIKNRARVFISGHEHSPSHKLEKIDEGSDLLMLASGAAAPPEANDKFNYCYNILEFDWSEENDALILEIHGRMWDNESKKFVSDVVHFEEGRHRYVLNCSNFRKLEVPIASTIVQRVNEPSNDVEIPPVEFTTIIKEEPMEEEKEIHIVLLKFFRDLSSVERLSLLIDLGAIPNTWNSTLTHGVERSAFDRLVQEGKLAEMHDIINQILQK